MAHDLASNDEKHVKSCESQRASPSIRQHGTASPDHAPTRLGAMKLLKYATVCRNPSRNST
jgi:hypothetical protein